MELVKKEPADLNLQRGMNLFLDLLDRHKKMPLCLAKVEIANRFGLALSDDQVLEIANDLLDQGEIKILKFVSRGYGFFDTVICREHRNWRGIEKPQLDQTEVQTMVLDLVRERPGVRTEVVGRATELIGDYELVIKTLELLEQKGDIIVDHERNLKEPFICTLS